MSTEGPILIESKSRDVGWWLPLRRFPEETRSLIRDYAGVDEKDVDEHITKFRAAAWEIRPYPCVGMFAFLKPVTQWAQMDNEYNEILERVKAGASIIDVGCAMGQDFRRLAADGAPTNNMCALDVTSEFWDASFDLFRDRSKMHAAFIKGDFFDPDFEFVRTRQNSFDILICGDFFHLFDWTRQVEAGVLAVGLGKAQPGTMIIGKQIGNDPGQAITTGWGKNDVLFFHDEESFRRMWAEVEERTGTRWDVKVRIATFGEAGGFWAPKEDFEWMGKGRHGVQFVMKRLS